MNASEPNSWLSLVSAGAFLILLPLAVVYCGYALYVLAFDNPNSFPIDLRLRWFEQQLFYSGLNPQAAGYEDPLTDPTHRAVRLQGSEYPPWSYAINVLVIPPLDWASTRLYFACATALMLGVIGIWADAYGPSELGWSARILPPVATLSIFPIAICISYGQLTLFVTCSVIGALCAYKRNWHFVSGLFLGLACTKPHIATLFVLYFVLKRNVSILAGVATVIVLASLATWALSRTTPISMLTKSPEAAQRNVTDITHNRLLTLLADQVGQRDAVIGLALVVAAGWAAALWTHRHLSIETVAAVSAITAMFLTYRKHYDAVILAIPMTVLTVQLLRQRSFALLIAWLSFGISLWLPIRDRQWSRLDVFLVHLCVWCWVAAMLLRCDSRSESAAPGRQLTEAPT